MKKFLRVFRTEEEYSEYTASTEFNLNSVPRCREGNLVFYNPESCGSQGMHRIVSGETYCDGYDKRIYIYKQVSYDDGVTWETTATTSSLVEKNSEDCGYVPPTPPSEWDITAKFNVTSTSSPTTLYYVSDSGSGSGSGDDEFTSMEIDGVKQSTIVSAYTFDTVGEHTVKYILTNKTTIGNSTFYNCSGLTSIVSNAITAPTITSDTFQDVKTGGTLTVPIGSSGYDVWMGTGDYYLGFYNWTKVEQ